MIEAVSMYGGPPMADDVDLAELREVGALVLLAAMNDPRAELHARRVRKRYEHRELARWGTPTPPPCAA